MKVDRKHARFGSVEGIIGRNGYNCKSSIGWWVVDRGTAAGMKVLAYFLTANFQAAAFLWLTSKAINHFQEIYPELRSWKWLVWTIAVLAASHLYFVIIKALLRAEKNGRRER
ncbi:MAG: hypothetical protein KA436_06285 [Oligoflexales bacterium]|nr:hypothetical protein [Oligoflexales bacterium]